MIILRYKNCQGHYLLVILFVTMTTMNVLLAADVSIKNLLGGGERVLYEEARFLAQQGHKVCILTRKLESHGTFDEVIDGIHEFRYEINAQNPASFLFSTIKNAQKRYQQFCLEQNFDVIHFHQPFTALAVNLLVETKNIKKVYTCHSLSFEEYRSRNPQNHSLRFTLNLFFRKSIEKFNLDKSDKITTLSQFTKNKLLHIHRIKENKIVVIPGGFNRHLFQPAADKNAVRQQLNIDHQPLILFTVRNLVGRMGLENLLQAVAILRQKGVPASLFIGGQGPLKEKLQALIKELRLEGSVTLCGFLAQETLLKYYQMADFFILPTIELEGFGLVTIEAMACATPVLATPIGGTIEILNGLDPSFLFKDTTPQAMADLIFEKFAIYKNNPDAYQQWCINARKYAEKNYSWEKNFINMESILKGN